MRHNTKAVRPASVAASSIRHNTPPKAGAITPITTAPKPSATKVLTEDAAPPDLTKSSAASVAAMPEPMRRELRDLGLR